MQRIRDVKGWYLKYMCIIKYYHPSSALHPSCFLKRPVPSLCSFGTSHSKKHSVTKIPHEISPSSTLGSALGHIEVTIAPRRMPACSHLLPKYLEVASVSNFVRAPLVLLLWSRAKSLQNAPAIRRACEFHSLDLGLTSPQVTGALVPFSGL